MKTIIELSKKVKEFYESKVPSDTTGMYIKYILIDGNGDMLIVNSNYLPTNNSEFIFKCLTKNGETQIELY